MTNTDQDHYQTEVEQLLIKAMEILDERSRYDVSAHIDTALIKLRGDGHVSQALLKDTKS
jgi:hypothetical protein